MLQNNNLKICRRLVWRDIKFHKGRSIFLVTAVALVCMLYTFSFSLGGMIRDGYLYTYRMIYVVKTTKLIGREEAEGLVQRRNQAAEAHHRRS